LLSAIFIFSRRLVGADLEVYLPVEALEVLPMADVVPHATLVAALLSPAFKEILPDLIAYAAFQLRKAGLIKGCNADTVGTIAEDVIQSVCEVAWRGSRPWPAHLDLKTFLRGVTRSWVDYLRRQEIERREVSIEAFLAFEEMPAPSLRIGDGMDERRFWVELQKEIDGDQQLEDLFVLLADSDEKLTYAEQATALGWDERAVKAAHERLRQRRDAVRRRLRGPDDESSEGDRPPSDPAPPGRRTGRAR
jgi:DNA-directed RNA polymerase specialized sigma24 family protein